MKCFGAIVLLAFVAVALAAENPAEKIEPAAAAAVAEPETATRDKRGLLVGAAYTAPVAYTAYSAPLTYPAAYSVPYAYSSYRSYPYYYNYNSPYVVV